jgi:hypothetical protein
MTVHALLLGDAPVRLWGLSSRERLARQLARVGARSFVDGGDRQPGAESVVLIRADHVYDDRVIAALVKTPGMLLRAGAKVRPPSSQPTLRPSGCLRPWRF